MAKRILSIVLCVILVASSVTILAGAAADYTILSPYEDVIWSGENQWGAYKGTLHSHTTFSDGGVPLDEMVKEYYNQGYDFLANADHGVTGVPWNKRPAKLLLYAYQGKNTGILTDEEFEAITTGTYNNRGRSLVCVTGANELNNLTLTKCHVNGYFLPYDKGNGFGGSENGFEQAIEFIEKNGGISHINHPGDWLETNANPKAVNDMKNIEFLSDLILRYDSCYGIEVFNEVNGTTGYDRILWDNMLMYTLPFGKTVLGYSNTDAHSKQKIDSSYSIFMMEENNVENIKKTMENGAFFAVTRILRGNDFEIGPAETINAANTDLPVPEFTCLTVDGHRITVAAKNAHTLQWVANGKVIYKCEIGESPVTIDLDETENSQELLYVRAELFGEGGINCSQPLIIDDGSEKPEYKKTVNTLDDFIFWIKSTRLWVIIQEIVRAIKNTINR